MAFYYSAMQGRTIKTLIKPLFTKIMTRDLLFDKARYLQNKMYFLLSVKSTSMTMYTMFKDFVTCDAVKTGLIILSNPY